MRNTVTNQDVKIIPPEDFTVETKKRSDRRKEINRPKRNISFKLENNMTREFRITDIVQSNDKVIKSGERNDPKTPGRLVKLKPTVPAESVEEENTAANSDAEDTNAQQNTRASTVAPEEP